MKPITPKEVYNKAEVSFPEEVIESFNELIAKNFRDKTSIVKQKDVVNLIQSKMDILNKQDIFNNKWLDVEDIYRKAGWKVEYDKPAYCDEWYEPRFTFIMKNN